MANHEGLQPPHDVVTGSGADPKPGPDAFAQLKQRLKGLASRLLAPSEFATTGYWREATYAVPAAEIPSVYDGLQQEGLIELIAGQRDYEEQTGRDLGVLPVNLPPQHIVITAKNTAGRRAQLPFNKNQKEIRVEFQFAQGNTEPSHYVLGFTYEVGEKYLKRSVFTLGHDQGYEGNQSAVRSTTPGNLRTFANLVERYGVEDNLLRATTSKGRYRVIKRPPHTY